MCLIDLLCSTERFGSTTYPTRLSRADAVGRPGVLTGECRVDRYSSRFNPLVGRDESVPTSLRIPGDRTALFALFEPRNRRRVELPERVCETLDSHPRSNAPLNHYSRGRDRSWITSSSVPSRPLTPRSVRRGSARCRGRSAGWKGDSQCRTRRRRRRGGRG